VDGHSRLTPRPVGTLDPVQQRPTARFEELVAGPEPDLAAALDEAAALLAAHANPGLDVGAVLGRLDELAAGVQVASLAGLRHHLFEVVGFDGNHRSYHDPRNSFLDAVLDRRVGIPISLAVVTMEVGRRLGVALAGVALPGHFLVREGDGAAAAVNYVDPFRSGRLLDRDGCEALYRSMFGETAPFDDRLLAAVGPRAILTRMLANLRSIYQASGDARSLGWALRLRAAIPAATPAELADRASAQAALARFGDAAVTLEQLSTVLPRARADRARATAALLRARLN
jgi:regulator of sirC expression with transglutaminase-like and TPR domain